MNDTERGLYNKFIVKRADGSSEPGGKHENCRYFVLDLDHDKFAIPALRAYAQACRSEFPELCRDLTYLRVCLEDGITPTELREAVEP